MEEFAGHIGQLRDSLESAEHRLNSTQEALTASKQLEKSMALYNSQLLTRRLQLEQRIEAMHSEILVLAKTSADDSRRLQFIESSRLFRLGRKLRLVRGKE